MENIKFYEGDRVRIVGMSGFENYKGVYEIEKVVDYDTMEVCYLKGIEFPVRIENLKGAEYD